MISRGVTNLGDTDHGDTDHGGTGHGGTGHGGTDHGDTDHGDTDHGDTGHGDTDHKVRSLMNEDRSTQLMVDHTGALLQGAHHPAHDMAVATLAKTVSIEEYSMRTRKIRLQQSRN